MWKDFTPTVFHRLQLFDCKIIFTDLASGKIDGDTQAEIESFEIAISATAIRGRCTSMFGNQVRKRQVNISAWHIPMRVAFRTACIFYTERAKGDNFRVQTRIHSSGSRDSHNNLDGWASHDDSARRYAACRYNRFSMVGNDRGQQRLLARCMSLQHSRKVRFLIWQLLSYALHAKL